MGMAAKKRPPPSHGGQAGGFFYFAAFPAIFFFFFLHNSYHVIKLHIFNIEVQLKRYKYLTWTEFRA
jgi:hypothetical protein